MQMVILCGGLATRLGNLAKNTPKSMIKIDGKPFLWYQIENLKKQGIKNLILCVGHLSEKIIEYFGDGTKHDINITYSHDGDKPLGPIGALKKAEPLLQDVFFIMYGDSYLTVDYLKVYDFFKKHDRLGCMVVYKNNDKYDKSNLIVKNNMVVEYSKEKQSRDMIYIDYGTSILRKKSLEIIPPNTFYTTGEFFSNLIKQKQLLAYEVKKRFYHIGNPEALREFKEYIKSQ
ncbi:MAG: nucleotidyl transferase [Thermoplasmata archaeon]|nr:MAG: nucleotidyl transferase [Thermoplasmata archaeon]RLF37315.1 MAG: nucleotidyl transferase [Thermoplasmata archaeon]RLF53569.1 MAG: nucleotidyl transferase [Thermoplasmata archaeon]